MSRCARDSNMQLSPRTLIPCKTGPPLLRIQGDFVSVILQPTSGDPLMAQLRTQPFGSRRSPDDRGRVAAFSDGRSSPCLESTWPRASKIVFRPSRKQRRSRRLTLRPNFPLYSVWRLMLKKKRNRRATLISSGPSVLPSGVGGCVSSGAEASRPRTGPEISPL